MQFEATVPTVSDRIAQMVVKRCLEPILEPVFHMDSYGYRPRKSAHDALAVARRRCWSHDWVLDLDIKSFFDEIDWSLLMKAVRRHTDCKWVLLYLQRWLEAPVREASGRVAHDAYIVRWATRKYKRFRGHKLAVWEWLRSLKRRNPGLFAHWAAGSAVG